jgi:hypothetical protein
VRRGHERPWTWKRCFAIPAVKVNEKHKQAIVPLDLAIAMARLATEKVKQSKLFFREKR